MTNEINPRFFGISRLLGNKELEVLQNAHIAVVGIGGVGSWVVESLARTGIGSLTLIDADEVCVSNVNRQIHAVDGNFGRLKCDSLAERVAGINPNCTVHIIPQFFTDKNSEEILANNYDFIVDCIDTFSHKVALIASCHRKKQPFVTVGTAGGRVDPTKIRISDLNRCENDPLVAIIRKKLRREHGFHRNKKKNFGVPCVWSIEKLKYFHADEEISECKPDMEGNSTGRLDCTSGFGAATFVTGTFGFFAAAYVVNKLTERVRAD